MSWRSAAPTGCTPDWRRDTQTPVCSRSCPSYRAIERGDGSTLIRCAKYGGEVLGLCLPMVKKMGELLDTAEDSGQHQTLKIGGE